MFRRWQILLAAGLISVACLMADTIEEYDLKIKNQNDQVDVLEQEINSLQEDIKASRSNESSVLDELDRSDKKIELIDLKIRSISREMELRKEKLNYLEKEKADNMQRKTELIERYRKRVVRGYKQHNNDILELLFSSKGLKQFYYRLKYLNAINQSEKKLFYEIRDLMAAIDTQTQMIREETDKLQTSIADLNNEQKQLRSLKSKRETRLREIRKNTSLYTRLVREKENSLKEIQKFISRLEKEKNERLRELERQRALRSITITDKNSFKALKGELPWPAPGTIVGSFGKHEHPVLKTITENTGVDIKVREGTPVQSIMDGLVTTVTWLRGYGNTIIIHHGEDYYTVYTRVSNVLVSENEYVTSGQVIAKVSYEGLDEGNILHFEIWDQQTKLNPEKWLRP